VCRIVRVIPARGMMTLEAVPTAGGAHPPLVVLVIQGNRLLLERLGNPVSIPVTAGTEVIAHVEMVAASTTSQTFTLTTSMTPQ
jgi:hypothetical protein